MASTAASGSQRWNGHSGALTANANMKPRNSAFMTAGSTVSCPSATAATIARKSKVPLERVAAAVTTYRPITAASMISPPNRLYSRNFTAALRPMRVRRRIRRSGSTSG